MIRLFPLSISAFAALATTSQVHAQATLGLTDAQKADILSHNTEASVDDARAGQPVSTLSGSGPARGVHGEIGAGIGTNGYRSAYGAAAIPLGDHAGATVMFESDRYGHR